MAERERVHECALQVLEHLGHHHDIRLVSRLLDAVVGSRVKTALAAWFTAHGPVSFDANGVAKFERSKPTKPGEANASPYWKFHPTPGRKILDPLAELEKLLRSMNKAEGQSTLPSVEHRSLKAELEALVRRYT